MTPRERERERDGVRERGGEKQREKERGTASEKERRGGADRGKVKERERGTINRWPLTPRRGGDANVGGGRKKPSEGGDRPTDRSMHRTPQKRAVGDQVMERSGAPIDAGRIDRLTGIRN